jgi:hypothetical protein
MDDDPYNQKLETPYIVGGELICEDEPVQLMPGTKLDIPGIEKIKSIIIADSRPSIPLWCVSCGQERTAVPEWMLETHDFSCVHDDGSIHGCGPELCPKCKARISIFGHHCNRATVLIIPSHFHGAAEKVDEPYKL